jgi:hypothetical protein
LKVYNIDRKKIHYNYDIKIGKIGYYVTFRILLDPWAEGNFTDMPTNKPWMNDINKKYYNTPLLEANNLKHLICLPKKWK